MHRVKTYARKTAWEQDDPWANSNPFHWYKTRSTRTNVGLSGPVAARYRRQASKMVRGHRSIIRKQLKYAIFNPWFGMLLLFVPAGFIVRYTGQGPVVVFAINFIAIIPLAILLGIASDALVARTGDILGSFIDSTFSNAAQFITSVLLLKDRQIDLLQISLVGFILSNMHLAVGLGFLLGGIKRKEQQFNAKMAHVLGTGLLLAVAALIVPTIIQQFQVGQIDEAKQLSISRGIAIVLILCYGAFLFYSLYTHLDEFKSVKADADDNKKEEEKPKLLLPTVIISIVVYTALLTFNTLFATDSLDGLIEKTGLTNTFIGIVLLPLLSIDPTMFRLAMENDMDIFLSLTVGKCLQVILLVIPVIILLGWIMNVPIGLNLDPFEAVALYVSIIYINNMIQAARSTYLQGILLLGLFVIICMVSFHLST